VDLNAEVLAVRADKDRMNAFIEKNRRFILHAASRATLRFVTQSDDEWSVALSAFHEAILSYETEKGSFYPFAYLVIKRRLLDYKKSEQRHKQEVSVEPYVLDGQLGEEEEEAPLQSEILRKTAEKTDSSGARDEIEAVQEILKEYGFSFFDLASCSPKSGKTKEACARAAAAVLRDEGLFRSMQHTKLLPVAEICQKTKVSRKTVERHRRYIIAAAEILNGDYPLLSEYMDSIRRAMEK
jgi:RNA polymerase sigma factor